MADKLGAGMSMEKMGQLGLTIRRGDVAFALGLMSVLAVLILPMPKMLLDLCLALSITFSVMILMTALFIHKPLEFSSFPTVLLVATMIRLSLNVASTRLILGDGHEGPGAAGEVIRAFGMFMMAGNYVIGGIVFAILVIINFVVITKGSGRIAEVSARFSLDALPGKQMAIDADLSAGLINEKEAKDRRKELEEETNFFGAMDGAAKYVRGDAIAGLLITFINIIGGIIIGVVQNGMPFSDALKTYTILTVGDGLVTQIPALIVSTAAGMLVSKVGQVGSADKALFAQLGAYPTALGLSSFLMTLMGLMPGIPMLPFFTLALVTGLSAWKLTQVKEAAIKEEENKKEVDEIKTDKAKEENIAATLKLDEIRLELGYGLLPMVNETGMGDNRIMDQIKILRKQLASEVGFILPSVRILDNLQLGANNYVIRIKEIEAGRGDIRPNQIMVMDPTGGQIEIPGEDTREPTFGLQAKWVGRDYKDQCEQLGYTTVEPSVVITTHLTELIKDNMSDLLSFSETEKLLANLDEAHQKLMKDVVPSQISYSSIQRILQNLLAERVSIRDLPSIMEGIGEICSFSRNITIITEQVRTKLARQLCAANSDEDGVLPFVSLSPEWEEVFMNSLVGDGEAKQLALPPSKMQVFIARVKDILDAQARNGIMPVILTSPQLRYHVRSIIERFRASTTVMSQAEIHPKARIKSLGHI